MSSGEADAIKYVFDPFQWCVNDCYLQLVKLGIIPDVSWNEREISEEKVIGYDQAFGGEWKIKERTVKFRWLQGVGTADTYAYEVILTMTAEIPLNRNGSEIADFDAQKRWFLTKFQLCTQPLEKSLCFPVLEINATHREDILGILKRFKIGSRF